MAGIFKRDRAVCIIAESEFFGIEQTAKRWGLSERTVWRYRSKVANDQQLAQLVNEKKAELHSQWSNDTSQTLIIALRELRQRMPSAATTEYCELIKSIAGVAKIAGELRLTLDALELPTAATDG